MQFIEYMLTYNRYANIGGIFFVLLLAFLFSKHKKQISYRLVFSGLITHFLLAFLVLRTGWGRQVIQWVADIVAQLYSAADVGIEFVFGALSIPTGAWGFVFAIKVLPVIIFFGAFMSVLFYFGIIQKIVQGISFILRPILGTSGAETLCAIANSFLGQTEAPLLIRHYIKDMTRSEIFLVMVSGMGTISGAILAVYALMGVPVRHLLSASVMAIPATIVIAKIMLPETETPKTLAGAEVDESSEGKSANVLDAIAQGTSDGLMLALNVGAMLIAFLALLGIINSLLSFGSTQLSSLFHLFSLNWTIPAITLQDIFGYMFAPFGWLFGFTGDEALRAGELIGIKVSVNELVAYTTMLGMGLSARFQAIITYALCGFSNFSCIGIQIGGIGALAPSKRSVLSSLGFKAVFAAMLANLLSAFVAGLLL